MALVSISSKYLMFNPGVLSLCVFTNEDGVDIFVRGFKPFYRGAWTNIREQIEGSSKGEIE